MKASHRPAASGTDVWAGGPPRIPQIDALKGFALLGICVVNAPILAGAWDLTSGPGTTAADRTIAWLVTALFTTKFYLIFSFLFGYSFVLQEAAADRDGICFARRHGRRFLGLFLIGLAHAALLYPGDILMTYAVLSVALFAARRLGTRTILRTAALLVVFLTAVFLTVGVTVLRLDDPGRVTEAAAATARRIAAYRGGPLSVVHANITAYRETLGSAIVYAVHLLAAALAGFAAGRRGLLKEPGASRARTSAVHRLLVTGLLVGLPGGVLTAMCTHGPLDGRFYYLGQAADILTAPALAAAYAAALLLTLRGRHGPQIARTLAPAGRMSLSNYLMQSVVLAFVFTGYGFRLYGTVGPAVLTGACVALWALQLAFSARLMAFTRYGPAELLLRRMTLGRTVLRAVRATGRPTYPDTDGAGAKGPSSVPWRRNG
ncbi:uncharacterized protein J2X68_007952 [Streptomyces sp. 3330]|uniref:DUF418 domain-containing protein n=1 Tax=Streptomyces sp. 3330 TaxID=2817755 RepID=UPI00285F92DD|nr:DUF418 domain-containing protein [Streptomyces sp. 3330]MDR6981210.1 uncharacterized protein [Streptomyces sp. 3330]